MSAKTPIGWTDSTWSPLRARVKDDAGKIAADKGYTSLVQIATEMQGRVGQHCEHVSPGCKNCYSGTTQKRCLPANGTGLPFDRRSRDLIDAIVDEKALILPLKWGPVVIHEPGCPRPDGVGSSCRYCHSKRTRRRRIFVENQSDLFGEWYSDEQIDRVFAAMALCPQHTFQVLTKRPERMLSYCSAVTFERLRIWMNRAADGSDSMPNLTTMAHRAKVGTEFQFRRTASPPLPNVWLGTSVEDQATADARIPLLLRTPAAKRFVSYEPALGPVSFEKWSDTGLECDCGWRGVESKCAESGPEDDPGFACPKCGELTAHVPLNERLDWIIVGGESGPGARPFDLQWARTTVAQCREAGVACFVKQLGAKPFSGHSLHKQIHHRSTDGNLYLKLKHRSGADPAEWPHEYRVQEFPHV